jgi:hypothetical protein
MVSFLMFSPRYTTEDRNNLPDLAHFSDVAVLSYYDILVKKSLISPTSRP